MRRILSTAYTETAFNIGIFILRASLGVLMCLDYGVSKLTHFSELQHSFADPLNLGRRWSLILTIVAEVGAAMLIVVGLFTRIAAFILVFEMCIVVFIVQQHQSLSHHESAILYLAGFFMILMVGPGRYSVDAMAGK